MPDALSAPPVDARETRVRIDSDRGILEARQRGRSLAGLAGFGLTDLALVTAAISELARNTLRYAHTGEIIIRLIADGDRQGVMITAEDQGPGILNINQAMTDGFSTSGSLGLGLPGVRRLMDEFEITSTIGSGTTVVTKKWRR